MARENADTIVVSNIDSEMTLHGQRDSSRSLGGYVNGIVRLTLSDNPENSVPESIVHWTCSSDRGNFTRDGSV